MALLASKIASRRALDAIFGFQDAFFSIRNAIFSLHGLQLRLFLEFFVEFGSMLDGFWKILA